jgi:hypothetical protein
VKRDGARPQPFSHADRLLLLISPGNHRGFLLVLHHAKIIVASRLFMKL